MNLLNEPWRDYDRRQRQKRMLRIEAWILNSLAWLLIGIGLGVFLQYLIN